MGGGAGPARSAKIETSSLIGPKTRETPREPVAEARALSGCSLFPFGSLTLSGDIPPGASNQPCGRFDSRSSGRSPSPRCRPRAEARGQPIRSAPEVSPKGHPGRPLSGRSASLSGCGMFRDHSPPLAGRASPADPFGPSSSAGAVSLPSDSGKVPGRGCQRQAIFVFRFRDSRRTFATEESNVL